MILTDYYHFERLNGQKSASRLDCTRSTGGYNEFEALRSKTGLFLYYGKPLDSNNKRRPEKALTKGTYLSGVIIPDVEVSYGYGDVKGTNDALLFILDDCKEDNEGKLIDGATIEIFVARGQKGNQFAIYNLLCDGELDEEISSLKTQAKMRQTAVSYNKS